MDRVRRRLLHDKDHRHLDDGTKPAEVLRHILKWHLEGATFLKADIIGIFEAHGFDRESAEQVVSLLEEKGELRPVCQGFWKYEPKEARANVEVH